MLSQVQLKTMSSSHSGRFLVELVISYYTSIRFPFVFAFNSSDLSIQSTAIPLSSSFNTIVVRRGSSRFRFAVFSNSLQPVQSSPPNAKEPEFFPVGGKSCGLFLKVSRLLWFEAFASSGPCLRRGIAHSSLSASHP